MWTKLLLFLSGYLLGSFVSMRNKSFSGETKDHEITDFSVVAHREKVEFVEPDEFNERFKRANTISDLEKK